MTLAQLLNLINEASSIEDFAKINLLKIKNSDDGRFILNYSEQQLSTPKNWISHFCRGLTFTGTPNNYKIIAKSFDRFYNLHEEPEYLNNSQQINYKKPFQVQFKFDGSLILQYLHNGKICINISGSFADSLILDTHNQTWEEVFNSCDRTNLDSALHMQPDCTPWNQVVEYYPKAFAKCLGVVKTNGTEIQNCFEGNTYDCSSLEEVLTLLKTLKASQEGFVIAQWDDENKIYIRKKIKTQTWLELSHIKESSLTFKSKLWHVVFSGDKDEVAEIFPHIKNQLEVMWQLYQDTLLAANTEYNTVKDIVSQKDFAIASKDMKYQKTFFPVRAGTKTMAEAVQIFLLK